VDKTQDEKVELDDDAEDSSREDSDVDELKDVVGEASCDSYERSMQLVDRGNTHTSSSAAIDSNI